MPYVRPKPSPSTSSSSSSLLASQSSPHSTHPITAESPAQPPTNIDQRQQGQSQDRVTTLSTEEMLTPRPVDLAAHPDSIADELAATHLTTPSPALPKQDQPLSPAPTLPPAQDATSTSTTSLASLSASSASTPDTTASESSELNTPPSSSGTPGVELAEDDPVARYREGLYAYTRSLYLEAKLVQKRKAGIPTYGQFGMKQSGMEKMAAKKALARRLNA
ncbi:hypothetical protein DB88DRAFT_348028 [Papiliotrema laurentii]|uniref:Uncharacterized protein n=1 Tax=Papiliotrema laurentii TaxID=5418 RepID=A0AAD9CXL3_PAPLA|nr:hypothetical protein DB88DRAFT_348028 [Papiliotrema laurentii]